MDMCFALAGSSVGTSDGAPYTFLVRSCWGVNGTSADVEFWKDPSCITALPSEQHLESTCFRRDLVMSVSGGDTAGVIVVELLTIRLGGAFGKGART